MQLTLGPGDEVWVNKLLMGVRIYTDFRFDRKGEPLYIPRRGDVVEVTSVLAQAHTAPYWRGRQAGG